MEVTDFTQDAAIYRILDDLKEGDYHNITNRPISDVIDGKYQYVDLVMEGGGVLGVALAGYVYIMEQMNIRFLQLGGTSAGAINTMLMAVAGKIDMQKTEWVLEQIANKNLFDFVDGDNGAKGFIDAIIKNGSNIEIAFRGLQVVWDFKNDFGLNPGVNFHNWLKEILKKQEVTTTAEFINLRKNAHDGILYNRNTNLVYDSKIYERVVIIASDITTESKIIFPEMASLFWKEPEKISPADYVRASMSIPFFFYPFEVNNIPQASGAWENWKILTGYEGNTPKSVVFVDGGIMSNFPIDVFHEHLRVPDSPTFGVKLGVDRSSSNKNDKLFGFIGSMFDSARHIHDYDFLFKNPDYKKLIAIIDTGDYNWLNFNISDKDKIDLFVRGAKAASDFLKCFDWIKYKKLRADLAKAYA